MLACVCGLGVDDKAYFIVHVRNFPVESWDLFPPVGAGGWLGGGEGGNPDKVVIFSLLI